jgi:hypothetical protein
MVIKLKHVLKDKGAENIFPWNRNEKLQGEEEQEQREEEVERS